uniref:MFS domain-containing protein n=1 Tax=Trichuris muris TaxID=70415 RepID=A0A5S6Q6Q0_TRIMR
MDPQTSWSFPPNGFRQPSAECPLRHRGVGMWPPVLAKFPSCLVPLCCCANFINAADRVIMPIAILGLAKEYKYGLYEQGWILSALPAGYISSQIVGSCAGAQCGGYVLLAFVVLMWSLSTLVTPMVAWSLQLLILTRVVLGIGEGLGLPTIYHLFAEDVPANIRSTAFSYLTAFGSIGQVVAVVICPHLHWSFPFYIFGGLGLVWCVAWVRYSRYLPPCLPDQSLYFVKAPNPFKQWRTFFCDMSMCSVYLAHFCMNWTSYVVMHWLPAYLHAVFRADPSALSLTCLPYIFNSLFGIVVGHFADSLVNDRRLTLLYVRKLCTTIGLVGPALCLMFFVTLYQFFSAILMVSLSMGLLAFNGAGHLSSHADMCRKYAGVSFAISNTIATLPGLVVGPLTADFVAQSSGRWGPVFVLAAAVNLVGAVVYFSHASTKPVI